MVTKMNFCALYHNKIMIDDATYSLLKNTALIPISSIILYIPTVKEDTIPHQYILRHSQFYVHSEGQNKSMQFVW